ncbi:MAG TPA: TlpA disulfide reductase family protein [Acidimicrobiia bacterium]|nr:TlpA disulfide reductase family protein [Acidimicrobiia bacterium]
MPSTRSSSTVSEPEGRNGGRAVRYLALVLIVLSVPISLIVRRVVHSETRVDPLHSGPAPAFALQSLDGQTVSLADFRGRPLVVNFWGAWCEQCTLELPLLAEMRRRFPAVPIVGVLYREDPEVGRAAAKHGDATWPTLIDPDGKVAEAYGVAGAPATFFIRPDGTITGDLLGPVSAGILQKQFEKIALPSS